MRTKGRTRKVIGWTISRQLHWTHTLTLDCGHTVTCRAPKDARFRFSECPIPHCHRPSPPSNEALNRWRKAARDDYASDGMIEIDTDASVSMSDEDDDTVSAYVQAWVYVNLPRCPECKQPVFYDQSDVETPTGTYHRDCHG